MRTLVTGASGYIGRSLVSALERRGLPVIAVRRADADLRDPIAARVLIDAHRPEVVVHAAWEATPGIYWTSPDNAAWAAGTVALAEAARAAGARRFVGVGSCAEYDWSTGDCDEYVTAEAPTTPYGQAKLLAAHSVLSRSTDTFAVAWARVFFLFGGHEHPARLVPSVAQAILDDRDALCTHGEQLRDFLHVDEVGDAIAALVVSPVTGVVNIASGEAHRVREVIEGLASRLGGRDRVRLGARATTEPARLVTRAARLRDDVGWAPTWTFDQRLDHVAEEWTSR
jgi:nucleoside-diphosphate-sugar epimerase